MFVRGLSDVLSTSFLWRFRGIVLPLPCEINVWKMKRLAYILLGMVFLLGACGHPPHLQQAREMWEKAEYDSIQYYLSQVDSSSLAEKERVEYYWLRMHSYYYMSSLDTAKADSLIRMLEEHYPMGHKRAFRTRLYRVLFTFGRLKDNALADSLIDRLKPWMKTHTDSVSWFSYKANHKTRMGEADSAIHYLRIALGHRLLPETWVYGTLGTLYKGKQMYDSAVHCYSRALEGEKSVKAYRYAHHIVEMLRQANGDTDWAWNYLREIRRRMKRSDIPFVNLIEGDIWMQMHQPDSAMKHYQIVADGEDRHLASQALERMGQWMEDNYLRDKAFDHYLKAADAKLTLLGHLFIQQEQYDNVLLKQQNLKSELKMERQEKRIQTLVFVSVFLLAAGGAGLYSFHRKNRRLKQEKELADLRMQEALYREKEALMREELLKRIHVGDKLQESGHIHLSDADWKDLRLMLDSTYPDFTQKLRKSFPSLTEKDINFCCLVKINMSLQSLADIYCISGNSVSRRKLRLKEKFGIGKDESLTRFLNRFA